MAANKRRGGAAAEEAEAQNVVLSARSALLMPVAGSLLLCTFYFLFRYAPPSLLPSFPPSLLPSFPPWGFSLGAEGGSRVCLCSWPAVSGFAYVKM